MGGGGGPPMDGGGGPSIGGGGGGTLSWAWPTTTMNIETKHDAAICLSMAADPFVCRNPLSLPNPDRIFPSAVSAATWHATADHLVARAIVAATAALLERGIARRPAAP